MKPAIAIGIGVLVVIIIVAAYFAFRSAKSGPSPPASADSGSTVSDAIDNQIDEIANDVANAAREGYISRREYMTPDPAQSVADFTKIVLSNVVGKPVKAVVSRDDVSGILKVVMTGVDPNVFEPAISNISDCVSGKIRTGPAGAPGVNSVPMYIKNCANDYFSTNKSEFQDKIVPAALTIYENAYNKYASKTEREAIESRGGIKKTTNCLLNYREPNIEKCLDDEIDNPPITWDKVSEILDTVIVDPPTAAEE